MIVTRSWLNEWVDISGIESKKLIDKLNSIGFEVASVKKFKIPEKVVVGKVIECQKHSDSKKLSICKVEVGENRVLQIVCGANNVKKDIFVPVALEGAEIANNLKIKKTKVRGIESFGMICSDIEIGLPKIMDGILILDKSIGEIKVGKSLNEFEILNDEIIDIELTANRGDCLSIYGIAREIAAAFGKHLRCIGEDDIEDIKQLHIGIGRILKIAHQNSINSSLIYKVFANENNFFIPLKIAFRLSLCEEEIENEIEKLTFYVTYTTGVILRCYSYEYFKEKEDIAHIDIKRNAAGLESVFKENQEASFIGIWQKEDSKPKKSEDYFIIEASYVEPETISKKYYQAQKKIKSDWSFYRSSRGSNPDLSFGINCLSLLARDDFGIKVVSGSQEITAEKIQKHISVNIDKLSKILGESISINSVVAILNRLEFATIKSDESDLVVVVPHFRHDVENIQDIAEEIVRFIGIDNISQKPFVFEEKRRINSSFVFYNFQKDFRERSVAAGFYESMSYVFANREFLKKLGYQTVKKELELTNPINEDLNTLRVSLVPNLLLQALNNIKRGYRSVRLFECGVVFDENRNEIFKAAFVHSGFKKPQEGFGINEEFENVDFTYFSRKISQIIGDFELKNSMKSLKLMHPFQKASVFKDSNYLGEIYKLDLRFQEELEMPPTFLCEIELLPLMREKIEAQEYSAFQGAYRDVSVLITKDVKYETIKETIKKLGILEIKKFYPIAIFERDEFGGRVSLTIRFFIQSNEKTLSEEDISKIIQKVVKELIDKMRVEPR